MKSILLCYHCCQVAEGTSYGPAIVLGLLLLPAPIAGLYQIWKNDEWEEQWEEIREMFGLQDHKIEY